MMVPMARVTLLTIAQEVGVSRTTVSNAFSRPDQLTDDLRREILATAERLGYHGPDAAARMLRTGRIGTIGLVFTEDLNFVFSDPNTSLFMRGVAEATSESNVGLTLLPVPKTAPLRDSAVLTTPVDGYLVFSIADTHPVTTALIDRDRPIVVVDEPDIDQLTAGSSDPPPVSFVGIDDRAAARAVAEHIAGLGHERVAIVTHRVDDLEAAGPLTADQVEHSTIRVVRERYAGYLDGLGQLPVEPVLWSAGELTVDAGRRAVRTLFEFNPEVTAVICTTDQIAIGACQALWRLDLDIPGDVSVAGFDDIPRASTWDTPITTMRQPLVDKGRLAAQLLRELLDDADPSRHILPTELTIRSSTGPSPSSRRV